MKRFVLIFVLVSLFVSGLSAQERLPTPSELKRYADIFWNEIQKYGEDWERKRISFNNAEINSQYATLGGDIRYIDTPLEATLAAYFVWNIFEPFSTAEAAVEAIFPHSNPRLVDRQLGTYVYMDLVILRFLGNTEAVGRHEGMLKFITDRSNVTRADVETYYRRNIATHISFMVDEQYAKFRAERQPFNVSTARLIEVKRAITDFMLNPSTASYSELLATYRRNAGEAALVLIYTMDEINVTISRALGDNRILGSQ